MRNDSYLYTGMTSSRPNSESPREKQKRAKEESRAKLGSAAEEVIKIIDTERSKVADIRSLTNELKLKPEELYLELKARNIYLSYLNTLEAKIRQIMAVKESK